jgi:hypothetical protein
MSQKAPEFIDITPQVRDCVAKADVHVLCQKGWDTVGELKSAEMGVSNMPSWKAKKLEKLAQAKVLLEL